MYAGTIHRVLNDRIGTFSYLSSGTKTTEHMRVQPGRPVWQDPKSGRMSANMQHSWAASNQRVPPVAHEPNRITPMKETHAMRTYFASAALLLCVPMTAVAKSPVDAVLKQVPEDAALVVVIPDFQKFTSSLVAFGGAAGIDQLAEMDGPGLMSKMLDGHVEGLDLRGAFVLAMKPGQKDVLLIGTVSNPDLWKKAAKAEDVDEDVAAFRMHGERWYAGGVGNVGILAKREATLRAALTSDGRFRKRFAPHGERMLKDNQLVVWADVAAWRPLAEGVVTMADGFMQMAVAMSDPKAQGGAAMSKWFFEQARLAVRESLVYGAGIRCSAEGVFGQDLLTVQPDGEIARYLGKVRKSKTDLLRGLPVDPGMLVFATEWLLPRGTRTFSEAVLNAMLETEQGRELAQDKKTKSGLDAAVRLYRQINGYSGVIDQAKDGGFVVAGLYLTENPLAAIKDLETALGTMMGGKLMATMSSQFSMDVTHSTERIRGSDADVYAFSFQAQNEEIKKALNLVYGEHTRFYVARHADGVAYAMGPGDVGRDMMAGMLHRDGPNLPTNDRIVAARKAIAPDPQICVFLDLSKLARFGMTMWQKVGGGPVPPSELLEKHAPLIPFGIYLDRTAMRTEAFVPAASVRRVIDSLRQSGNGEG